MFEAMLKRIERLAERRVEARREALARELAAELPAGIEVARAAEGVRLSGRGIARRFALDPRLRWLVAGLVR